MPNETVTIPETKETIPETISETETIPETETISESKDSETQKMMSYEDAMKLVQSQSDKVRTDYTKKVKEKEQVIKDLERASMTAEEKRQVELADKEAELSLKEQRLLKNEMTLKANDLLRDSDLDISLRDVVYADTEEKITENIKNVKTIIDKIVESEVQKKFKEVGYIPGKQGIGTIQPKVDESKLTDAEWKKQFGDMYKKTRK